MERYYTGAEEESNEGDAGRVRAMELLKQCYAQYELRKQGRRRLLS